MKNEQAEKLHKVLMEIKPIAKDKTNPHYKSSYADINTMLEDVKPILHKHGLLLLQPIIQGNVVSQIIDVESGEIISESSIEMTANLSAQQKGSEITYFRRYTLQSMLGLEAEDDDGNTASAAPAKATPQANEPTEWLNLFDKQGYKTEKFANMEKAISEGKKFTLKDVRAKYKVSKEVAVQLEQHFNIV